MNNVGRKYAFGFVNCQLTSRNMRNVAYGNLSSPYLLYRVFYSLGLSLELKMVRNVNDLMVLLIIIFKSIKLYNDVLRIAYQTQKITLREMFKFGILL